MISLLWKKQSNAQITGFEKSATSVSEISPAMRYTGLENQGATCYLNTVLQILFMTEDFREAVEGYKNNDYNINNHITQLFESLKSGGRNTASTERITTELKINVHKQEDAAKCLQKILNKVDPELSKIFQGVKVDTTVCRNPPKHHEPLEQVETFFIISVSLDSQDHVNVQSCFDSYFAPIIMCGEDQQIYCKHCEMMMDTETSSSLQKVPSVLVLHLERFEFDYDTMCCVKNESRVEIPAQLSVKEESGRNHRYDLYAIANHIGSLIGGHYYADIKSFEDQHWYRFDDTYVEEMPDLKCDLCHPLSSKEAYLLLYRCSRKRKKDIDTQEEDNLKRNCRSNSEPEHPQTNQHSDFININDEKDQKDQQNQMNNSESDSEIEVNASPNTKVESKPDIEMKSTDVDHENQSTPSVSSRNACRPPEHININIEDVEKDQQDKMNNDSESDSETDKMLPEASREMHSNDDDSDSPPNPFISSNANRASKENKCSDVIVELEPINKDNQTHSNTNIDKTRQAQCLPIFFWILLTLFVIIVIIIVLLSVYLQ